MSRRNIFINLLIITIVSPMIVACQAYKPRVGASWMQDILHGAPEGPNKFKLGWHDGCQTGIAATANQHAKFFYKFTQQYELAQDNEYYTGWRIGMTVCSRYVYQFYKRAPI